MANKVNGPNIMHIDIETSPCIGFFWRPGNKISIPVENVIEESKIICICYKWADKKKVHRLDWGIKKQCDKDMLEKIRESLEKADLVVGQNGDRFDLKWINGRTLYHGLPPISIGPTADTLKMMRKHMYLNSYKMDYVGGHFNLGHKVETGGFSLWKRIVLDKDPEALKKMLRYCEEDVRLLERLFNKIVPYTGLQTTHAGLMSGVSRESCPACGSENTIKYGTYVGKAGKYQKRRCQECGHPWKDSKAIKVKK